MGKKRQVSKQTPIKETKKQKVSKESSEKIEVQPQEPVKSETQPKKKNNKSTQKVDVLSAELYAKFDNFQGLYKDFLTAKASVSDTDVDSQMRDVTSRVSNSIQNQASQIFKQHLQDLQKWIQDQINKIADEIKSIENVYQQNRESLLRTGAFSQDQVKKQLAPIQAKVASKKEVQEKYENLLEKSKEIYG